VIPGHEIVGRVGASGPNATRFPPGARVGIPWLAWTCGECGYCKTDRENLCTRALFTGYTRDGGYAEYVVADERFCLPLAPEGSDVALAPLLCAGLIGYRCWRKAGPGPRVGFYGFGAAALLLAQVARHESRSVYAFTRPGDTVGQAFARSRGAVWAGDSTAKPPEPLDAAIIFAPVGGLVPAALAAVAPGGRVVCGGIHMSLIPAFSYDLLWEERTLSSVANLTRRDGEEYLALAPKIPVQTVAQTFPLAQANEALARLRRGEMEGAAVLVMD
jgi:propanol-preferring alcohol dehydrogenase